ncbi:hypothetical protein QW180_23090 [Vibrio sinaloensis]|nr:hypothetical protein [Vibrio sinaloensis]
MKIFKMGKKEKLLDGVHRTLIGAIPLCRKRHFRFSQLVRIAQVQQID